MSAVPTTAPSSSASASNVRRVCLADGAPRSYGEPRAPPLCRHARRAARALRRPRRAGSGQHADQRHGHPHGHRREHADQGPHDRDARPQPGDRARAADDAATARSPRPSSPAASRRPARTGAVGGSRSPTGPSRRPTSPTARSAAGKLADSAVTGAKIADGTLTHRRHRPLLRRLPDPRRGPRDDQAARVLEPRAARPRARARRRRHLPGRAAGRRRAATFNAQVSELQLPHAAASPNDAGRRAASC